MKRPEFKGEFEKRFAQNEWETLRQGGANCPKKGSYDLYIAVYSQTVAEMKRLGYGIPKAYMMPKKARMRADAVLESIAKTWSIVY